MQNSGLTATEHVSLVGEQGASDFSYLAAWEQVSLVGQQDVEKEEASLRAILPHASLNLENHLTSGKKAGNR